MPQATQEQPIELLIVDDDPNIRQIMSRLLQREGYLVHEADGTEQGLAILEAHPGLCLVLSDLHMPDRDGREFLDETHARFPATAVIMLTGDSDVSTAVECLKSGAADYLTKPMVGSEVIARVEKALAERSRRIELRRLQDHFEHDLLRQVTELSDRNKAMFLAHVQMAVTMLEARDPYTSGHSGRVADYAVATARVLGLEDGPIKALRLGAELHDIGKIGTPDAVLQKPGPLTPEERELIQRHTLDGVRMLGALGEDHAASLEVVRSHHERMDGTGFPDRLVGEGIPFLARIVCVVDAYDAMTTTRSYRPSREVNLAAEELRRSAGSQFDPRVVEAFLSLGPPPGLRSMSVVQPVS